MTMTRRDMMKQTGMVAVVSAVAGSFADDLVVSADAAPLNAIAGVDRVVMRGGRTYLNGWAGYGEPPRRTRGAREAAPPAPADSGPPPATAWSKLSGPGDVQFADAKAAVTTATFSTPGIYVLQVVADNGTAKASSTLTVKVELPPPDPDGPHMFRCAQPGYVSSLYEAAGLREVAEWDVEVELVTRSTAQYWEVMSEHVSLAVAALQRVDGPARERIRAAAMANVEAYESGGAIRVPGAARCIVGTKP